MAPRAKRETRKRYRNISGVTQIVYVDNVRHEIIPAGTLLMTEEQGAALYRSFRDQELELKETVSEEAAGGASD